MGWYNRPLSDAQRPIFDPQVLTVRFPGKCRPDPVVPINHHEGPFTPKPDGVDAPTTASMFQSGGVETPLRVASVSEVTTIGLDIAKNVFHAHGADERGAMVFSRKLTRAKLLDFFAGHMACVVALEACGGAHHRACELQAMGHEVRLSPTGAPTA